VIPGDRKKPLPALKNKPYFEAPQFPEGAFLTLDASTVGLWEDPRVDSLHGISSYDEFKNPQLLVKQSFVAGLGRFRAARVLSSDPDWGVICKKTYLSVRDMSVDCRHIDAACAAYNSSIGTYFLFMTSSRLGHYITEVLTKELVELPIPPGRFDLSLYRTFDEIDNVVQQAFALSKADRIIVDEFLKFSLPDAIRQSPGPTRAKTQRNWNDTELHLYADTFIRVLKSTFGKSKDVCATVYEEPTHADHLPVRMLTIHLGKAQRTFVRTEEISTSGLLDQMSSFHREVLKKKGRASSVGGIGFQRVAFLFHLTQGPVKHVQNLTIIKPDECRYWTQTQAMRDADELAASIVNASQKAGTPK
jgi:hypothetical protein